LFGASLDIHTQQTYAAQKPHRNREAAAVNTFNSGSHTWTCDQEDSAV